METVTQEQDEAMLRSMRIIVAGSRPPKGIDPKIAKTMLDEYRALIFSHLNMVLANSNPNDVAIISGMAAGADMIGHEYARERGLPVIEMPADWEAHQKKAGYLRNVAMAEKATHAVVYYDGQSKGSAHMIDMAKKHGLALRVESKATPELFARYGNPAPKETVEVVEQEQVAIPLPEVEAVAADKTEKSPAPPQAPVSSTKPLPPTLPPVEVFEPPAADQDLVQVVISEPERFRILEQMQNIVLEVQEGVEQMPNSAALPLKLTDPVGDEIPVVALDLETTGFNASENQIIEVGLVRCMVSPSTGQVTTIERACSLLEQSDEPLSDDIIRITGITDAMLDGHTIDDAQVASYFDDAPLVIAHNAAFDRPFFENRFPNLQGMNWLCSIKQAPWQAKGFESSKLEYLGMKSGFFYTGHRAAIDALAIIELLGRHNDVFPYMLEAHKLLPTTFRAVGAPFSAKDDLKAAGFRWDDGSNSGIKAWYYETAIPEEQQDEAIEQHKAWMKALYGSSASRCGVEVSHAWQRFMTKDVIKHCDSEFKGIAKEEPRNSEPTL